VYVRILKNFRVNLYLETRPFVSARIYFTIDDFKYNGRRSERTSGKKDGIKCVVTDTPSILSRPAAQQVGLSHTSTYREIRSFAYPYKITKEIMAPCCAISSVIELSFTRPSLLDSWGTLNISTYKKISPPR